MENEKSALLRRLSAAEFALWETTVFLDTHPDDQLALASFKKYKQQACELEAEYKAKFGPLTSQDSYGNVMFQWIDNPWPWERSGN